MIIKKKNKPKVPTLYTCRLKLRALEWKDLDFLHLLSVNPKVMKYINHGRPLTREQARRDLNRRMKISNDKYGYWVIERLSDQAFIGWVGLKPLDKSTEIEIGYRFLESYWGRGYATEAASCILDYAFRYVKLNKVVAVALKENQASQRVMEKCGMEYKKEGVFYGENCVYYELLNTK
ncbi:MAG: GNAT family N-acetyltransferase [Bacteroidota bacterium]